MKLYILFSLLLFSNLLLGQVDFTFSTTYNFNSTKTDFLETLDSYWERNRGIITTIHRVHKPESRLVSRNFGFRTSLLFLNKHEVYFSYDNISAGQKSDLKTLPIIINGFEDMGLYETVYQNNSTSLALGYSYLFKFENSINIRISQDFIFNVYKESTYFYNYTSEDGELSPIPPAQAYFTRFKSNYFKNALDYKLFRYGTSSSFDFIFTGLNNWVSPLLSVEYTYLGKLRTDSKAFLSFLPDGNINLLSLKLGLELRI